MTFQDSLNQNAPTLIMAGLMITAVMMSPTFGVTVEALQAPVRNLKTTVFGGWMMPVQILGLACAGGMSFFKQSLVPFGVGVGTVAGINFFDTYLGDGAAGALI
jgi:type IV secretory pathway VirB2 component (pilin)